MGTFFDKYINNLEVTKTSKEEEKKSKIENNDNDCNQEKSLQVTKDTISSEENSNQENEILDPDNEKDLQAECSSLVTELIDYFTVHEPQTLTQLNKGIITKDIFLKRAEAWLQKKGVRATIISNTIESLKRYMWGYYILEDLIDDDEISDIKVLSYDNIQIKRLGKRMGTTLSFRDNNDFKRFVKVVATKNQINISDINAIQNFTDKNNNDKNILRFNISSEYVNSVSNPYLQIRKISKIKRGFSDLVKAGMMDENTMQYISDAAKTSSGILICGKGGSGKTTLMNAMIDHIPKDKAGLVLQENEELFSKKHPNMMFQHVVESNNEDDKIRYGLEQLGRNGLLLDLDYYIIGEVKGIEAEYLITACMTGHQTWASLHSNSSTDAANKLIEYTNHPTESGLKMCSSFKTIIFMKDFKVAEISEVTGFDYKTGDLKYKRILKREDVL